MNSFRLFSLISLAKKGLLEDSTAEERTIWLETSSDISCDEEGVTLDDAGREELLVIRLSELLLPPQEARRRQEKIKGNACFIMGFLLGTRKLYHK